MSALGELTSADQLMEEEIEEEVGDMGQPQEDSRVVVEHERLSGVLVVRQAEQEHQDEEEEEDKNVDTELEDLELSLQALEKLDRSSPDLWPDHIPGVNHFVPVTPSTNNSSPATQSEYLQGLSREDLETLMQLGGLSVPQLLGEVKRLQNIAYELGQEETKEMTRGKYLNILRRRHNT